MISISPCQKFGSEKPKIDPTMIDRPAMLSGFRPAHSPSGMPTMIDRNSATAASSKVAGMRSRINSIAGSL